VFHRFFLFIASLFMLSCSMQSKEIEVVHLRLFDNNDRGGNAIMVDK
jgi:hypothetical protein